MAIDNKENPDEGTPRSKKDIRKERRQMRETNRYRKSVGGEPLYSKQEIKDVEKPFKAEPGKALSGTIGGVTYNDPNKPTVSETTYEYQRSGGGKEESIGPTTITKEQATALNSEDVNTGAKVRQAIEAKAANNPNATMNDIKVAQEIGKETEEEINTKEKQIDQEASQQTGQNGFKMTLDLSDEEGKENIAPTTNAGDGSTVNKVVSGVPEGETNWTNVTTYGDGYQLPSDEDINARASQAKKKVPQLVIEKLGVQDYYPEIGRDIAVGNFSGSYAGSRTIYSGAGGLLPLGLYDARKRAIATEIKRKEALMDQLKEIPEISKQFQPYFSGQYVEGLNKFVNAYKDNPDGLMNDPEFRKFQAHYKSIGENFLKVDKELKDFSELLQPKDGNEVAYATPGMLEIEKKIKSGFLPDKIEDWFSGKKNISNLSETVRALPNGYSWADKKVELLIKEGEAEIPIYPKDGVEWNPQTQEEIKRDVNGLVMSLKDGSSDYETYLTSLKKYFKFDFDTMADEWIKGNSLDGLTDKEKEEYKKSLVAYMLSNMPPDSIVNKVERQTNDNASRYASDQALKGKLAAINWDREKWEREQRQNPTNALIDAAMASKDGKFTQDYAGSRGNSVPLNKLNATVIDKNGKTVTITGAQLKSAPAGTYRSTINKQPIDPGNLPSEVTYQATQGTVRSIGAGDYVYSNSGLGFTATTKPDQNGNTVTSLKGLDLQFSMPDVRAVTGGKKIESTIDGGNVFFGQGANQQTYKTRESSSSGSFERE